MTHTKTKAMLPIAKGGLCPRCASFHDCEMSRLVETHRENQKAFGEHYKQNRPDLWHYDAIDEPDIEDGVVTWCPIFE